jgi:ferritin-like metal-binding protein YciE
VTPFPVLRKSSVMKSSASKNKNAGNPASPETATPTHGGTARPSMLEKFFTDQLKDILWAEQQLLKVLPELQQAATTEELEDAFESHIKQTERHVRRLEKVFAMIGKKPEPKTCEAMVGLIREAREVVNSTEKNSMTRDAALIIAAQKVEHYEIATYGGLVELAMTMGLDQAADLLDRTLCEEEQADHLLTNIAEDHINMDAEKEGLSWNQKASGKKEKQRSAEIEEEESEELVMEEEEE